MTMPMTGWGAARWGGSGWGGPASSVPRLLAAVAVGENAVQVTFSSPIYFSGLLDPADGSARQRYSLAPVAQTFGQDGSAAKPVGVASAALSPQPGQYVGECVVLTTDRPMTPSPAQYVVSCNGLFAQDGSTPLDPLASSLQFEAVFRVVERPQLETASPRGDLAVPQSGDSVASLGEAADYVLGSFVVADGDYASRGGMPEYKERVFRRIVTRRDAFLHLAGKGYGASALEYGKRRGSAQQKARLLASVEQQVGREPETAKVAANLLPAQEPGLFWICVLARTRVGKGAKVLAPVHASG